MPKTGEGIYLRGVTWWMDFRHHGVRHVARWGTHLSRTVVRELARVKRAEILKGAAGLTPPVAKDLLFDVAAREFLQWAQTRKRPRTVVTYRQCLTQLAKSFRGKRLSQIHPFLIVKHKRQRIEGGSPVRVNRELLCLKALFHRCRDWGLYDGDNPASRIKFWKEPLALQSTSRSDLVLHSASGRSYRAINNAFHRACQLAGLTGVTLHTLRHTFASRLVMAGVDLRTVQDLGGWKSLKMIERYAHLNAWHKRAAVEKICHSIPNSIHNASEMASRNTNVTA